jgi:hypothetical protein
MEMREAAKDGLPADAGVAPEDSRSVDWSSYRPVPHWIIPTKFNKDVIDVDEH